MSRFVSAYIAIAMAFAMSIADAAIITIEWVPFTGATAYDIEQSVDLGVTWVVALNVKTRSCTTTKCSVPFTPPASGLVLFRIVTYNALGKTIRTSSGFWYNGGWQLPGAVGGAEIVKIQ